MKRNRLFSRIVPALLLCAATISLLLCAVAAEVPTVEPTLSGVNVYQNARAAVDYSNLAEGYLSVRYFGGKDVRIKVLIARTGGTEYSYDLNNKGTYETFPLVEGDGEYTIRVYENTTGNRYAQALSVRLTLALRNEFLPFLYPNQYVNFTAESQVSVKAAELVAGQTTDLAKLTAVYRYVIDTLSYDYDKAKTVKSGYLPVVDDILAAKKGICFDYAAVMATMLRSQGIPCKLIVGYAGTVYHAWINVYLDEQGWVEKAVYFDGESWKLMDPTFASTGKSSPAILRYIGDGKNYTQKYAY